MLSFHSESIYSPPRTPYTRGFSRCAGEDLDIFAKIISRYTWSSILWRGGHRLGSNFEASYYLALDCESRDYPLKAALEDFRNMRHIIGTTQNHGRLKDGEVKDRFRVLIPWSAPITERAVYSHNMIAVMKRYDCDAACKDLARQFYKCRDIVSINENGDLFEVAALPQRQTDHFEKQREYGRLGYLGRFAKIFLTEEIPLGQRNGACYRMGCELARAGVTYEDAIDRVLNSPTYSGCVVPGSGLYHEIRRAVRNGYKAEGAMTGDL